MKKIHNLPRTAGGLWILIVAAVVLEGTACIQYFTTQATIRKEAEKLARTELQRAELEIEKHTIEMETAAKTLALLAEKYVDQPDSIFSATRFVVSLLNENTSVAVAFVPGHFNGERLAVSGERLGEYFEPCSSRITEDSIFTRQIGSADHDYTQMEWYQNGFVHDSCWWCEPYLDDSGSQTFVVSCSCPVHDREGNIVAVVCVDLSLAYLANLSSYLQIYPNSFFSIRSSQDKDIVAQPDTVPGRKYTIFDEEIDATGWHISIIIPDAVIYADLRKIGFIVTLMMLIGLAVLVFIMYRAAKTFISLSNLSHEQERMESELNIARNIQMAMLPTRFPPFPDYPNLNAYGLVIPAKEVGGDLFDFYIRDNRLFFCIGDVSGKGVPASLVMAMTRSLFRSFSSYIDRPATMVTQMNDTLSGEGNDQNMFVTLFLGVLDLSSGELLYCNAGHNAPILVESGESKEESQEPTAQMLDVLPNLPLGVLAGYEFAEQSAQLHAGDSLFLYTDGLTEAENTAHQLFGEERMMPIIEQWQPAMSAAQQVELMQAAVKNFVGTAQQSDDLTMFAIRYLDKRTETGKQHFSLVMRNDIQQIPTLAEWIDSIGLPAELNMPINLALEEAVSNVMLYAYPETDSGQVLVEAEKTTKQIIFTISDSGIAFDPTQQAEPDITQSAEERPIGGLGIFLVRQIMDDIHYERANGKNILKLTKQL